MDKNTIYIILTLIKAIAIIVGMVFVFINLIPGIRGDKKKLKKAAFIFLGICVSLTILTAIEFAIALN